MSNKPSILIVDDEELVRDAFAMVLDLNGFKTTMTSSAQEALIFCEQNIYDVIITDIVMPEMDGVSMIQQLRKMGNLTPVIAISGGARMGQKNMLRRALEVGACIALRKPITKQEILDAISLALKP